MANRSYLYASDTVPKCGNADATLHGISEWNYEVPLSFLLLMSDDPRPCASSIFEEAGDFAVVGNYDAGVSRLLNFAARLPGRNAAQLRDEAQSFLARHRRRYLVLEPGELFWMSNDPPDRCHERLLAAIREAPAMAERVVAEFAAGSAPPPAPRRPLLSRLFGRPVVPPTPETRPPKLDTLGFGNWSDVLYYDPSATDEG